MGRATLSPVNPGSRLGLIADSCGLGHSGARMMLRAYVLCVCRDFPDSVDRAPLLGRGFIAQCPQGVVSKARKLLSSF
jgi:hypothetical protein